MNRIIQLIYLTLFVFVSFKASSCTVSVKSFEFASEFYKIQLTKTAPFVKYFSVDAMGNAQLENNPILWDKPNDSVLYELRKISDSEVRIYNKNDSNVPEWTFKFEKKKFTISSDFNPNRTMKFIDFRFDKQKNHTTLLGVMTEKKKMKLPAVLHLPDMGTFRITANASGSLINFDASRKKGTGFISVGFPEASPKHPSITYTIDVTSIYPEFPGVEQDRFAGYRRNYLNLFQINPRLAVIANNSSSDPCAMTLFLSSMLALHTPRLADSLTALDLLKMSVERYLNGMKAYGMVGYTAGYEGSDAIAWNSPYNSLDSYPSLIISACNYIRGSNDKTWALRYYPKIKEWMDDHLEKDTDRNGLVEYELSGNSGSWDGVVRPANWWDTVGYGYEDAFSNALTYEALGLMCATAEMAGKKQDAEKYKHLSEKLKDAYFKTFYNPATGVLAGWKSRDGDLHDYYFVGLNSMAVYYNLVPEDKISSVMTALWNKMQQLGYTDFSLGIPGNLINISKEDYTHPNPRWGGENAFQRYENGGASLNWSYFVLKAFRKAGLNEQLKTITDGVLSGINSGEFQGVAATGEMTKDWKTWTGECWGYEGYLCDGYLVLLALNPEDS
ncbi:MAG: GH116 family glycosyl hydrolase [Prolixibacteraceae bacterium]